MNVLFQQGSTETTSQVFNAPATIVGFSLAPTTYEYENDSDGSLVTGVNCGDYVVFERVLLAEDYKKECGKSIKSDGVLASTPLMDECCKPLRLTACNNEITIEGSGTYRAIYIGDGRAEAIVIKE